MNQYNDYWFAFDEPTQIKGEIICAFHTSSIKRNRSFFFITKKEGKYVLVYSVVDIKELIDIAEQCNNQSTKKFEIEIIAKSNTFQELYNKSFVNELQIPKEIINNSMEKIYSLDFEKSDNKVIGLDGFSVDFKRKKEEQEYHCWCHSNDEDFFVILDFVNLVLDLVNIDKEYRFVKESREDYVIEKMENEKFRCNDISKTGKFEYAILSQDEFQSITKRLPKSVYFKRKSYKEYVEWYNERRLNSQRRIKELKSIFKK